MDILVPDVVETVRQSHFTEGLNFDSYEGVRARTAFKANPSWEEKIRELLQNEPWSSKLTELQIKVNLLRKENGFILSLQDDDIGCDKTTFLQHLLKMNQESFTTKTGDNKYGQGLQNMVLDTQYDPPLRFPNIYIEMKTKGNPTQSCILHGDSDRSIQWEFPENPKVKGDSGWYISMTFAGMSKRHKSHQPEAFVTFLYNILKEEYFSQLNNVDKTISIKLGGSKKWDASFLKSFNDLDNLQPKTEYYWTNAGCNKLTSKMPHTINGVSIKTKSNDDLFLDKIEFGKRPGIMALQDRKIVQSEEEYKQVYSSEMGDKPKISICSIRTGNVLHQHFFKNHPVHMNGMEFRVYIDIQDESFTSSSLTKTPFFFENDERLDAIVETCKDEWEKSFPDEKHIEEAFEWWIVDELITANRAWTKKFYRGEVMYTIKDDEGNPIEVRGLDGAEKFLTLNKTERRERVIRQFSKGADRPDITIKMMTGALLPTEVKPKAFNNQYLNQALGYFIGAPKNVRQTVLWGYNLAPKHYDKLNLKVAGWKDGKLEDGDRFIYIDIRELGFNDSAKSKYMKKVKERMRLKEQLKRLNS